MNVPAEADNASPSYTLKVNVTAPFAFVTGTYVSPPRFAIAMSSPAETSAPPYLSVPVPGSVVMSTDVIASPESTSAYPQSLAVVVKVCVASSLGVADPPDVVGASFVFDITMSKSSLTAALLPSVQVSLTDSVPTLAFSGVPP